MYVYFYFFVANLSLVLLCTCLRPFSIIDTSFYPIIIISKFRTSVTVREIKRSNAMGDISHSNHVLMQITCSEDASLRRRV